MKRGLYLSLWNRIDQYFKRRCMKYLERIFSKELLYPDKINWHKINRIFVVRPHDQLGDFLLATPVLRALRESFPEAIIGIVVRDYFADVVKYHPYVDRVVVFYKNGLDWTLKRICSLWRGLYHKWDMAVVLSSESHSLTSDLLALLSGAKYILGSEGFIFSGCTRNFFYNLISPNPGSGKHQSERNLDVVRYIGADTDDLSEIVYVTDSEKSAVKKEFKELYNNEKPIIGIHIGANKIENRWPIKYFSRLAQTLHDNYNFKIALFWGPKEEDLYREFLKYVSFCPVEVKPTTLRNQAIHFSLCNVVVCSDTGIMHLCAAVGTPLVAIFGPTNPEYWKPIGSKFIAIRGKENKTENVKVEQVIQNVKKLLQQDQR